MNQVQSIKELHLIGLCNMFYEILAKFPLSIIGTIIHQEQNAFMRDAQLEKYSNQLYI